MGISLVKDSNKKKYTLYLPVSLIEDLKDICLANDEFNTVAEMIRKLLFDFVKKNKDK